MNEMTREIMGPVKFYPVGTVLLQSTTIHAMEKTEKLADVLYQKAREENVDAYLRRLWEEDPEKPIFQTEKIREFLRGHGVDSVSHATVADACAFIGAFE